MMHPRVRHVLFGAIAASGSGVAALNNGIGATPALAWSSWNHFGASISDALLRQVADAMNASGLVAAGYQYLNLDDGWAYNRSANGSINPDPTLFPYGMKPLVDYIHSKGLKFGIYTARGSQTCLGHPGSDGYEQEDANSYASWGVDYLKEDSCGGTTHGTVWEQYARMRDALNATGRPIYFSITEALAWSDGYEAMHCYGDNVFTVIPWLQQGYDPTTLANSALVEYCNNMDFFGSTDAAAGPGGFLSNLDSQQLLTFDNLTQPGFWNDNDMLEVCNGGQTQAEYRSQFSTWSILASPLILGHDPRAQSQDCLDIILNTDVIAVNQDPLGLRGKLVLQWPDAVYPTTNSGARGHSGYRRAAGERRDVDSDVPAPATIAYLTLAVCNASDPAQLFAYNATDSTLRTSSGDCVTYGGYHETNVTVTACVGWASTDIGAQLWNLTGPGTNVTFNVLDTDPKVLDVYNCECAGAAPVQVCSPNAADCYNGNNCGSTNQQWVFDGSGAPSTLKTALSCGQCIAVSAIPPPAIVLQVWVKPLVGGDAALLAFNRDTAATTANLSVSMFGWPQAAVVSLYDLWQHSVVGNVTGNFSMVVQPHDVVMVRGTRLA